MDIQSNELYKLYKDDETSFMEYMESKFKKTNENPPEKPTKKVYEKFYTWFLHMLRKNKKDHIIPTGYTRSSMSKIHYIEAILKMLNKILSEKSINNIDRIRSVAQTEPKQNEVNEYDKYAKYSEEKKNERDCIQQLEDIKQENANLHLSLTEHKQYSKDYVIKCKSYVENKNKEVESMKKNLFHVSRRMNEQDKHIEDLKKEIDNLHNQEENEKKNLELERELDRLKIENVKFYRLADNTINHLEELKNENKILSRKASQLQKQKMTELNECYKRIEKMKKENDTFRSLSIQKLIQKEKEYNNYTRQFVETKRKLGECQQHLSKMEKENIDYANRLEKTKSEHIRLKEPNNMHYRLNISNEQKREFKDSYRQLNDKKKEHEDKKPVEVKENMLSINKDEMDKIRKASEEPGIVRSVVRVRCTDEKVDKSKLSFTEEENNNFKYSVIRSVIEKGNKPIYIKQPREKLVICNDQLIVEQNQEMKCTPKEDIKLRNLEFIKRSLPNLSTHEEGDERDCDSYKTYTIIAYGQSGSGKTTSIKNLFEHIKKSIVKTYIENFEVDSIDISFVDIYKNDVTYLHDQVNGNTRLPDDFFESQKRRNQFDEYTEKYVMSHNNKNTFHNMKLNKLLEEVNKRYKYNYTEIEYIESTKRNHKREKYSKNRSEFVELNFKKGNYEDFCKEYEEITRKVFLVRPTSKTPENINGSSRSHLITRLKLVRNGVYQYINLVDLAGGEDYSELNPKPYNKKLVESGCMDIQILSDAQLQHKYRGLADIFMGFVRHVREESKWINKSLDSFMTLIEIVNERKDPTSHLKEDEDISKLSYKSKLVEILVNNVKIASLGTVNTLLVTFKSETESETLKLAQKTLEKLIRILPKSQN